jgi:uncharacterized protein (TIGR03083 family)
MTALVTPLTEEQVTAPSYDSEWTIAQVASHLGSQAEIFELFLDAGLTGKPAPGGEAFAPIWDRWNAKAPMAQVADSVAANEVLVTTLERMPEEQKASFALNMFGMDLDVAGFAALRLGEHAVHTWDIAVALDPTAVIADDAVQLVADLLPQRVGRIGKPVADAGPVVVTTTNPDRTYLLTLSPGVELEVADDGGDPLRISAEAFIRLLFGRLDPAHTPSDVADDKRLDLLRTAFPGF